MGQVRREVRGDGAAPLTEPERLDRMGLTHTGAVAQIFTYRFDQLSLSRYQGPDDLAVYSLAVAAIEFSQAGAVVAAQRALGDNEQGSGDRLRGGLRKAVLYAVGMGALVLVGLAGLGLVVGGYRGALLLGALLLPLQPRHRHRQGAQRAPGQPGWRADDRDHRGLHRRRRHRRVHAGGRAVRRPRRRDSVGRPVRGARHRDRVGASVPARRTGRQPAAGPGKGRGACVADIVAVVILNWNCAPDTIRCLRAVAAGTVRPAVIVVDNGSADDSVAQLERLDDVFSLVKLDHNLGYAGGMNAGIAEAYAQGASWVWLSS